MNKKIYQLLETTNPADADELIIRKTSESKTKKITVANFFKEIETSLNDHKNNHNNPHETTAGQVGADIAGSAHAVQDNLDTHKNDEQNPHAVTKTQVGLENVTNDAQVKRSEMGEAGGVATLDEHGVVPIDQLPEVPSFVDNEIPAGDVDGANRVFTLDHTPITGSLKLYLNGQRLSGGGIDFTLVGDAITMAVEPLIGSILLADYRF